MRTQKEIEKEIKRICKDERNFVGDNYGSESADNGIYEVYFDAFTTADTLREFAKWLLEENK